MEISNESDISLKENDSVCRVCLSSNEGNKCIFTFQMTFEDRDSTGLLGELQFFGGIEVKYGDGLPSKMCDKCIANVRIAHDFRVQCQESDKKLRSLIKKVSNENYENLSHGNRRGFASNRKKQSGELYKFNKSCSQISTASVNNSARIIQDRIEFSENAIELEKIGDENPLTDANMRRAQSLTTFLQSDTQCVEEPSKISTKKLAPSEKSKKINSNSMADKNLASNRSDRRSRRSIVFRRVTSMENLKNCREQQRRYVKKATYPKNSRNNHESTRTIGIRQVPAQARSDLGASLYKCTKCCRSYKTKRSLDEHQFSHERDRFSCYRCEQRFGKLVEFLEHAKSHGLKDKLKPATCKICKKNFRKVLTMVRHLHVHKIENPRAVYTILKDMRDKKKIDKLCKFVAERNISDNVSRLEEKNMKKFADSLKDDDFPLEIRSNSDKSLDPSRTLGNWDDSEIPSDDTTAIKLINIWIREELGSDNEGKGFPCDICKKSYATKKSLLKHVSKIHDGSSRCDICQEHCTCPDKTRENNKNPEETKFYRCNVCEKTFEKETQLLKHMQIHARDKKSEDKNFKRFLCHICSKTFRQNTGLMFHMRTHTGYKPHVCKYCGRGFTSNSNCINHERTHTGDRPFVCHFCSAAFAKSCTLKAHITTHTGEANYDCKTCGKSFRRLKYLKEHRFTHTGEKPYACKMCGTAYSHSGSLFVHEKKCKAQYDNHRGLTINYGNDGPGFIHHSDIDTPLLLSPRLDDGPVNPDDGKIFIDHLQSIDRIDDDINLNPTNVDLNAQNFSGNGQVFQA